MCGTTGLVKSTLPAIVSRLVAPIAVSRACLSFAPPARFSAVDRNLEQRVHVADGLRPLLAVGRGYASASSFGRSGR